MAESRITVRADTSALTTLNTLLDQTRQKLTSAASAAQGWQQEWEELPGGGIRRLGRAASQGAGTYVAGAMAMPPMGRFTTPAAAFQQALPNVQRYSQALGQATQQASTLGATLGQVANVAGLTGGQGERRGTIPPGVTGRAAQVLQQLGYTVAPPPGPPPAGPGPWGGWTGMLPSGGGGGRGGGGWGGWTGMMPPESGPPPGPGPWGGWTGMMPQSGGWGAWTGMMPPTPPPPSTPWWQNMGGRLGQMASAGLGGLSRIAGPVLGAAAGFGIYRTLTDAMQNYETRALGVLRIGSMLDEQYGDVNTSLIDLRRNYRVLAQDGVAAMTSLSRVTGSIRGLPGAIAFGRAYNIEPEQAATLLGQLQRLTGRPDTDLGAISMVQRDARHGPVEPLPVAEFAEATAGIAATGGANFLPLPTEQYARFGALMTSFGPRFAMNPAQAYQQYAQELSAPVAAPFDALRRRSLDRLAQRKPTIMIGGRAYNIRDSYWDYLEALELAPQSGEIQEELFRTAQEQGGGNTGLQQMFFQGMFGTRGRARARMQFEGLDRAQRQQGIAATLQPRLTPEDLAREATEVTEPRIERQRPTEGFALQERAAAIQALGETGAIASMEKVRTDVQNALGTLAEGMNKHKGAVETVTDTFNQLSGTTKELIGVMMTIVGPGKFLRLGGAALAGFGYLQNEIQQYGPLGSDLESLYGNGPPRPSLLTPAETNLMPRKPSP